MYYDDITALEMLAILGAKLLPIILIMCIIAGIIEAIDRKAQKELEKKRQKKAASIQRKKEIEAARQKMIDMLKNI